MDIREKAEGISRLFRERRAIDILPPELMPADLDEAYRVRAEFEAIEQRRGRGAVAGYKIGLTTPVMQRLCGVDEPCYGAIFATELHHRRAELATSDYCRLGIETEIAVRMGEDLPEGGDGVRIAAAVESVMAAIELLEDLRHDYTRLTAAAMVAGNVWNAGVVLGAPVTDWRRLDLTAGHRAADDQRARDRTRPGRRRDGQPAQRASMARQQAGRRRHAAQGRHDRDDRQRGADPVSQPRRPCRGRGQRPRVGRADRDLSRCPISFRSAASCCGHLPPETAHRVTLAALAAGLGGRARGADPPVLRTHLWGRDFPNPIGIAAGFDKDARVPDALLRFGFGFVEVGTVTPLPQPGNPRPRVFRLEEDRALINRLGFNNSGLVAVVERLRARAGRGGIVGINIGRNRDSADALADYVEGVWRGAAVADYLVVNVSSPNTPGLRDLQARETLEALLRELVATREATQRRRRCSSRSPPIWTNSSAPTSPRWRSPPASTASSYRTQR